MSEARSTGVSKANSKAFTGVLLPGPVEKVQQDPFSYRFETGRHPHLEAKCLNNPFRRCPVCRTMVYYWKLRPFTTRDGCPGCNPEVHHESN